MQVLLEDLHPEYINTTYTYSVPGWPGGTNTIYATFGLDTYNGPAGSGGTITVSTNLTSQTFSGIALAGCTVAMSSSDGVLSVTTAGVSTYYGFQLVDCNITAPLYLISNPNSEEQSYGFGSPLPLIVNTSVDFDFPLRILPGQINALYAYQFLFNSDPTATIWSVSGNIPPGVSFSGSAGTFNGTPTVVGEYHFTISITSTVLGVTVSQNFILPIYPVPVNTVPNTVALGSSQGNSQFFFHHNNSIYMLAAPTNTLYISYPVSMAAAVYKSLDDGQTWNRMDAAGEAPNVTGGYSGTPGTLPGPMVMSYRWDGQDTIWFLIATDINPTTFGLTAAMMTFDLRTDTWSSVSGGTLSYVAAIGIGTSTYTQYNPFAGMVVLSTGVVRCFFFSVPSISSGFISLSFSDYNGTSFTSPTVVTTTTKTFGQSYYGFCSVTWQETSFIGAGTLDATHIWYYGGSTTLYGSSIFYIRVNGAGIGTSSHSSIFFLYFVGTTGPQFQADALLEPASNSILFPVPYEPPAFLRGTPLEAPVWTLDYVLPANVNDSMNAFFGPTSALFLAADGREACLFWSGTNTFPVFPFGGYCLAYYDPGNPAGAWSVREEIISGYWDPPNANAYQTLPVYYAEADPNGDGFYIMGTGSTGVWLVHWPTFGGGKITGGGGAWTFAG